MGGAGAAGSPRSPTRTPDRAGPPLAGCPVLAGLTPRSRRLSGPLALSEPRLSQPRRQGPRPLASRTLWVRSGRQPGPGTSPTGLCTMQPPEPPVPPQLLPVPPSLDQAPISSRRGQLPTGPRPPAPPALWGFLGSPAPGVGPSGSIPLPRPETLPPGTSKGPPGSPLPHTSLPPPSLLWLPPRPAPFSLGIPVRPQSLLVGRPGLVAGPSPFISLPGMATPRE